MVLEVAARLESSRHKSISNKSALSFLFALKRISLMISRFLLLSHLLNINFCCTSYNFLLHSIVIYAFVETLIARTFNHIYNFFKCLFFYSSILLFRPIKHLRTMVATLISVGLHNSSAARTKSFIAY